MRLETLQRIEYTLYRTAMGDLPWLHQGVIVNPAEGKLTRRPSVGSAAQNRTPVKKTTNVTKSATGSTSTVSSSIASKMNKAANTLSKWFSPSKSREYGAKETPSTQISAADAAYASTNFTKEDDDTAVASEHTGGIRQNLFEIYYFEKLHAPRARGACAYARASREGRRDESTVNNSSSKLKNRLTGRLGNLLLFPSMGRGNRESK